MLQVHRAERADLLVAALAGVVQDPLDDPFAPETVAVPTRGVERWLTQQLSTAVGTSPGRQDGVCANIDFPFPGRLVGGAVAMATGVDRDADPWLPERSVWPLLDVVEERIDDAWLAALAAHLGGPDRGEDQDGAQNDSQAAHDSRRDRRFTTLRHLADLFDRYGVHRPAMIGAWAQGRDTDAHGGALRADTAWQAQLWRALRKRLAVPSPAERLAEACAHLRDDPDVVDLPPRLSLFGLTRLPASYLDILHALAAHRDVHLFLLHPSPALWQGVAHAAVPTTLVARPDDPTAHLPANPLLASWGRDAREMQLVVTAASADAADHHLPLTAEPATLLERLQADIRDDRQPPGAPLPDEDDRRVLVAPEDRSVQVHACHGRARQVEVVRDAVAHLLAEDATLEPRDVIVMCPDIETFAPLIHATFGLGTTDATDVRDGDDDEGLPADRRPPDLRVRLADRSIRQTNPVLGVVAELLDLATARLTASQVIDLASREPVRRRFGFDDDDLARMEEWVAATGIRWGLDAGHRAPYRLGGLAANTWASGLDRLLLGVAMDEDGQRLLGGALPLDDVDSGDISLAGRLGELVERLTAAVAALHAAQPVAQWAGAIAEAADALTATGERDTWQRAQLQRLLDDVLAEATIGEVPSTAPLALAEVRSLLADRLRGRPTRANFRTGHLTMCTLVPMRSVPHRVVCLLGLDDEAFPRKTAPDGDDLIGRDPCVGDRDPRSEDRQLLLDALLAARDHLVITYTARDERTNAVVPPAVPLGELLDAIDLTARTEQTSDEGAPVSARDRVVVAHPLQPFDVRNFTPGALIADRPWSFDRVGLDGAKAAVGARSAPPAFLPRRLAPHDTDLVELDDLVRFVQHPVKAFLRQRLGVVLRRDEDETADALPIELDKLQEWSVGQRLLESRLAGADMDACRAAEVARGHLPPEGLGAPILDRIAPVVDDIVAEAGGLVDAGAEPGSVEVNLDLGSGLTLAGTVADVLDDLLRPVTYSRLAAKHRLAAWVRLLALTAAHPDRAFHATSIGRGGRGLVALAAIGPLGDDAAQARATASGHLAVIVDVYLRGMREPLPLYCNASAAYAEACAAGRNPVANASEQWTSEWRNGDYWSREDEELEHRLVLGGVAPLEHLLDADPLADEAGDRWPADEPTRFGRYARRLWDGLLAHERVTRR